MSVQDEIMKRIKEEINNDPYNLGYAGKTDEEIKDILNSPMIIQRLVQEQHESPMNRIMRALAEAPNTVSTKEVADSKNIAINP